jgi:hypothetical protein
VRLERIDDRGLAAVEMEGHGRRRA